MANEITIIEMSEIRGRTPIKVAPPITTQTISLSAASAAFNSGTKMIAIRTTTDCVAEFSPIATKGGTPDGSGAGSFPLKASDGWQHWAVRAGDKVICV